MTSTTRSNPARRSFLTAFTMLLLICALSLLPALAFASGGSGSGGSGGGGGGGGTPGADTIKVSKGYYFNTGAYFEWLLNASSSDSTAHLYAFLADGTYLGEVQNGGGGRYGGTVFVTLYITPTITIVSSSGGSITVPAMPGQL